MLKAVTELGTGSSSLQEAGGRYQEDNGSKPLQANSLRDPILKNPITKTGLLEWLKV
jgi:hypothetical protein